jgi:ADP-ribose pyrophosphatase
MRQFNPGITIDVQRPPQQPRAGSASAIPGQDMSEKQLGSQSVFHGKLLHVMSDQVRLPNGHEATREYILHPGAAMIIAMPDDKTIVLERQYRYPLNRHFIELPAGKIDPGEDPLATAQRELREECGYLADTWRHLTTLHPCIAYSNERIELYLARGLTQVRHKLDEDEFLEVLHVPVAAAIEWIRDGRITEAKAVTGLLWAEKILRGEW